MQMAEVAAMQVVSQVNQLERGLILGSFSSLPKMKLLLVELDGAIKILHTQSW